MCYLTSNLTLNFQTHVCLIHDTQRERTVNCQVESFYSRGDCAEILGRKKMSRVWQMSRSCRDIVIVWAMSKLRMSGCAEDNFGQTQIRGSGIENDSSRLTVPSARGDTSCTTGETEKENQGEKMTYWRNRYIFKSNHQNWLLCTVLDNFTLKGWSMSVLRHDRRHHSSCHSNHSFSHHD